MKSISAAVVVAVGLQTIMTSSLFIRHDNTQMFVTGLGVLVVLVGIGGWVWAMLKTP